MTGTLAIPTNGRALGRRRAGNLALWILQGIAVLGFIGAAVQKLTVWPDR
jgi:hypothetical protein